MASSKRSETAAGYNAISVKLPRAFSFLDIRSIFRSGAVCKQWLQTGFSLEVWDQLYLCAQRRSENLPGTKVVVIHPYPESNIYLLSADGLYNLAHRLRRVAEQAEVEKDEEIEVLPKRPSRPSPDLTDTDAASKSTGTHRPSQVEVFKYRFGGIIRWFLQYNTESFGWFDHTTEVALGLKIWAPCLVMCHFLHGPDSPAVAGRRCLELGAGAGMMGVILANLGADVIVTDIDPLCLKASQINARLNGVDRNFKALRLEYGKEDAERFAKEYSDSFDYIFGADILYVDKVAAMLFETADRLLSRNGCFYLGVVERHRHITQSLRSAAAEAGYSWLPPRPVGKEFAYLCPAFRGRKYSQPGKVDNAHVEPRAGMGGALFEFQQELRAFQSQYNNGSAYGISIGEPPERVELYCFVRSGAFRFDRMD